MLQDLTAAVVKSIADITNLTGIFEKNIRSAYAAKDLVEDREQSIRYKKLLRSLGQQIQMQGSIPAMLLNHADKRKQGIENKDDTVLLINRVSFVLDMTQSNLTTLTEDRGTLLFENIDLYEGILASLRGRQKALSLLAKKPEVLGTASPDQIRALADAYDKMMSEMDSFRRELAAFITVLVERTRPKA